MAFDLCVIPASVVPYLSALKTRQFSMTNITAHLVSDKLTREQCRSMTPDTFASSHALHVRSSVSSEINLAITSSVSESAPSGHTIVIQGCLNDSNSPIVLGVCVSDEPIVADASLRLFVNIEETNNVFRLRADFDGMVTQGLLDQSLEAYPTTAVYDSSTKKITFKNASNTALPNMEIDASAFIKFVVADVNTPYPSVDNFTDNRPSGTSSTSGTSSDNPHYKGKNASFMFDVSELPSDGTTFEVFIPSTTFVGSVQLVYGSLNYIYPIYFRGNDNVHCPTVPQGSVLRITFYKDAFYGDFYDFGDEHEAYVYVGKVPVGEFVPDLYSFSGLVGIDRDTGKFSQLFNVTVTDNGAGVSSPRLKENSPIYACFHGDCFAAHPKVPFGNILRIHKEFYDQGTLFTPRLPFTYYPFDNGDTVDAHVVTNTSSQVKYFQVDNCPVYIQVESNRVLLGNPPADIPARLIGFMCSGAENAGMIRLVESADVSYMSDNEYSKTFAGVWDDNSVDTSLSYMSDNVLVGLSNSSSKLVPLLVDDACGGDVMINPDLDWDSPVYVLFAGHRCFSAHPLVDFRQVLKKYDNGYFMFTFSPMGSVGSETPDFVDGADRKQYFGRANYPVFIRDFHGSYSGYKSFCVGTPSDVNIPSSDLHWRLLGYTTSKPGYIRLTESHPFLKDFIYQTGRYVKLSDFDSTTKIEGLTPSEYVKHILETHLEYNPTTAVQELVSKHGESVFHIKDLNASSGSTYAEELNGEVYVGLPHMTTIEFKDRVSFRTSTDEVAYIDRDGVYHGNLTGNADTATKATADASGNTITSYYCTLSTAQTVSGSKTFSGTSKFTSDVYITGYSSGGLRFADSDSLQKTDYVRVCGNCGSSPDDTYSGIEVKFYVDSDIRHSLKLQETKNTSDSTTSGSSTSYDLSITPSDSNICTLGSSDNKMKAIYATTYYGTTYYGLAEQLYGTGVGSLYLIKFKAENTSETRYATYRRGEILESKLSLCTISNVCNATMFNGPDSTTSTAPSSGHCLYMYDGDRIYDGVNGVFRLLNDIALPASSTRYFLALVVRIS